MLNFSSRRNSTNTDSNGQLEEVSSSHGNERVHNEDDDSDGYLDEDWGSFSESDGYDNEAIEPDQYDSRNRFSIYDTPEGNNAESQPTGAWRVAHTGDVEEGKVNISDTLNVNSGRPLKVNLEGFCNYSFQSDDVQHDADDEHDDGNIYEELKRIGCKKQWSV